uniref:Uncharacterized protein n=1 Tax=Oryza nivara TaxID=4536 RepID=A0A0E0HZW4_ORYNI
MEPTNIAVAGRGRESPLSLNGMLGGRSIIGKRFRNQDNELTCSYIFHTSNLSSSPHISRLELSLMKRGQ